MASMKATTTIDEGRRRVLDECGSGQLKYPERRAMADGTLKQVGCSVGPYVHLRNTTLLSTNSTDCSLDEGGKLF